MLLKLRTLNPTVAIGVLLSIIVSAILVFTGQDGISSLIVGLSITIISILLEIMSRVDESEKRILRASKLDSAVLEDPVLLSEVSPMIEDFRRVKKLRNEFFATAAGRALSTCSNTLHELAEGRMFIEEAKSQFNYGGLAKKSVRLVNSYGSTDWNSTFGQNLIRANEQAIQRGVKFSHLWIQSHEKLSANKEILERLQKIGVDVRVATPEDVPPLLREHYRIVDSEKLIKLEVGVDGQRYGQRIYIKEEVVKKAIGDYHELEAHTKPLDVYFAQVER